MIADGRINPDITRADAAEIIKAHKERGVYKFADLAAALSTVDKFRQHWSDAGAIADDMLEHAEGEADPHINMTDMPADLQWIAELHAAMLSESHRRDQRLQEEEAAERERVRRARSSRGRAYQEQHP